MKLAVFGATGTTGKLVVEQALRRGTQWSLWRKPAAIAPDRRNLSIVKGDVLDRPSIVAAIGGVDAVISAFGPANNKKPGTLMSDGIANIVAACAQASVPKLVFESGLMTSDGAGLSVFARTGVVMFRTLYRKLYHDKVIAERTIRESPLAWVIVRPPALADTPARGGYKHGVAVGVNPTKKVSHADVAEFLVACATDPSVDRTTQDIGY